MAGWTFRSAATDARIQKQAIEDAKNIPVPGFCRKAGREVEITLANPLMFGSLFVCSECGVLDDPDKSHDHLLHPASWVLEAMGPGWADIYKQALDYIANWPGYYEELQAPDMQEFAAGIVNAQTTDEAQAVLDKHLEEKTPKAPPILYHSQAGAVYRRLMGILS